jgi:hypothetical protein
VKDKPTKLQQEAMPTEKKGPLQMLELFDDLMLSLLLPSFIPHLNFDDVRYKVH